MAHALNQLFENLIQKELEFQLKAAMIRYSMSLKLGIHSKVYSLYYYSPLLTYFDFFCILLFQFLICLLHFDFHVIPYMIILLYYASFVFAYMLILKYELRGIGKPSTQLFNSTLVATRVAYRVATFRYRKVATLWYRQSASFWYRKVATLWYRKVATFWYRKVATFWYRGIVTFKCHKVQSTAVALNKFPE